MKRNQYIQLKQLAFLLSTAAALFITACKKDGLLNQLPPTSLSNAGYWHTTTDLQNYLNNFYNNGTLFPRYTGYGSLGIYSVDGNSDDMLPSTHDARLNGELLVSSSSLPTQYSAIWPNIYNVNYFLANYSRVAGDPATIAPFVGEGYLFRAMFYFQALQNFGALPWINKPLEVTDTAYLNAARLPRNIVADSIVSDLDNAIANLLPKSSAQQLRVYKEYAEAYKSRVCLFEGTWEKYHAGDAFGASGQDGTAFLQLAANAADSVMASGVFGLDNVGSYSGYFNLFNQTDYSRSKEIIFWSAFNPLSATGSGSTYWQNYYQAGSAASENTGLNRSLVNDYLCTDGKPAAVSPLYRGDDSMAHIVANRDPRLRQTIFLYGDTVVGNVPNSIPLLFTYPAFISATPCTSGFQIKKGLSTDYLQSANNPGGYGTDGVIYMRYAEVLLNYAEARAELGVFTQSDADKTVNQLRNRVGMPVLTIGAISVDPNWLYPELPPLINEIRRERHVELACEGFRLNDVLRWAAAPDLIAGKQPLGAKVSQFLTVVPGLKVGANVYAEAQGYVEPYQAQTSMAAGYKFDVSRDYLLPVDIQDLNLNPNIKQNPGGW
jgi:hypothetical protein